jgi:hypothetical protein
MTAYFLMILFATGPFQMVPMPDMATCQAMMRQARHASGTPSVINTTCQKVENGSVTEGSFTAASAPRR